MNENIQKLETKQAIYEITDLDEIERGWESSQFLVKKNDSKDMRPILNLKPINHFLKYEKFKMEGTHTLRQIIRRNDYLTKVDMTDAYLHIPVCKQHHKYLQFRWRGKVYRYRCLPFGLTSAPRVFTKMIRPFAAYLRSRGVRMVVYLDDILILAKSHAESVRHTKLVTDTLKKFGFLINLSKSSLQPKQQVIFLGNMVNSQKMELTVPIKKLKRFLKETRQVLRLSEAGRVITLRKLAGIIGKLNSLSQALESVRLHLTGLHRALRYGLRHRTKDGWASPILLKGQALNDLKWWKESSLEWNGKTLLPLKIHRTLYTDASDSGYGGIVLDRTGQRAEHTCRGFWNRQEEKESINWREMMAVKRLVDAGLDHLSWKNMNIEIYVDNVSTMFILNKGDSKAEHLSRLASQLLKRCHSMHVKLILRYVPGVLNTVADRLSRWTRDRSNYTLCKDGFRLLDRCWGPHSVDWTADRDNAQLDRYCSRFLDDQATYVDVLKSMHKGENGYSNPPFALIPKLLSLVEQTGSTITMVVPIWLAQPWWPVLLSLTVDFPLLFPRVKGLFRDHHQHHHHSQSEMPAPSWGVAAFRLSSESSQRKAFLRKLGRLSSLPGSQQLLGSMSALGLTG